MGATRQYCITCPRSDWQAVQELAKAAGMKTSPFILREVLGEDCRMALTGGEQRQLHDRVLRMASLGGALVEPLAGSGVTLGEALAFLGSELRSRQQREAGRRRGGRSPRRAGRGTPDLFGEGPR